MASAKFLLEHFYYGQLVHHGKPTGEPRLLAASAGVSPEVAALAVERVTLPPLIRSHIGSWALIRGRDKHIPFLLVQSQQGRAGQLMSHYIIAHPDALRAIGGNLNALMGIVENDMPVYEQLGDALPLLELSQVEPLTVDEQVDDLLDLMTYTQNRINLIESLLAAIVQGVQLIVQGAPDDIHERVSFIMGLLALLPPSARFGVTFTTHSLPSTDIDVQIRFYSDDPPPENTLIYNWAEARIGGDAIDDDYSHFVVSQLRLDAELVIERTSALTQIAGWRINRGDKLADALAYGSQRQRLDEALRNNQPVNKDDVGKILAEDPTLSDELRVLYASHLIKFSLAMQDLSHAEPVAMLLRANPELETSTLKQMEDALEEGQAGLVYDTLITWMSNPLGPEGRGWVSLTHRAALKLLADMVRARDIDEINALIKDMQDTGPSVAIGEIVPRIIEMLRKLSALDVTLAENLFLLVVKTMDSDGFLTLIETPAFRDQLPASVKRFMAYVEGQADAPPGIMVQSAQGFGEVWETEVLLRFAEMARRRNRLDLIDAQTLRGLAQLAMSENGRLAGRRILGVLSSFRDEALPTLEALGAYYLVQIKVALGDYEDAARLMIRQSSVLYPGDKQHEYLDVVRRLFSETHIPVQEVPNALASINRAGIRSVPYFIAAVGAISQHPASPELDEIAFQTVDSLFEQRNLLEVTPPNTLLELLNYHVRRQDVHRTIEAASLIPVCASYQGQNGITVMGQMYKLMTWDEKTRLAGLQMLRAYVRETGDEEARRAVAYFGRELGDTVKRALEVTYMLKQMMGNSALVDFAERLRITAVFLHDVAAAYADSRHTPSTADLINSLGAMPGALNRGDAREIADNVLSIGRAIVALGKQHRASRPRDDARFTAQLIGGEADPRSNLDIFRVMGGYFARGKALETPLSPPKSGNIFDGRTAPHFKIEVETATGLLNDPLRVFVPNKPVGLTHSELHDEIESQWSELSAEKQREIVRDLATDLQGIADLAARIAAEGDGRVIDEAGAGKKFDTGRLRPKNTLELFRFIYGFYVSRS